MANIKIDIHQNKLELKLSKVPKWKVPDSTKQEIYDYIEKGKIGQVTKGRRLNDRTLAKHLSLLKHVLEVVNKPTIDFTKEDVEIIDRQLTKENLASAGNYRLVLKGFLKWKLGEEKANHLSGWMDVKLKKKTPDYLSEQEILKLYKNCKNPSERFLIAILFDSGARAEEFLNIRYEDIQIPSNNENFVKITLKEEYSKTKGRTISLYWKYSLDAIRDFVKEREEGGVRSSEQIFKKTYDSVRMFLMRLGKKVLHKKIHPHLFRHSSATFYATKLNRQELCYRYGWAFSSDMPDVYISRSGMENKQLDEKFKSTELEELQKKFEKEKFERERQFDILTKNLNIKLSTETEEREKSDAIIDRLLMNPVFMRALEKRILGEHKKEVIGEYNF